MPLEATARMPSWEARVGPGQMLVLATPLLAPFPGSQQAPTQKDTTVSFEQKLQRSPKDSLNAGWRLCKLTDLLNG